MCRCVSRCLVHLPTAPACLPICMSTPQESSWHSHTLTLTHTEHSEHILTTRNTLMAHGLITQHTDTHEHAHITTHIQQYAHAPSHYCTYVLIRTHTHAHSQTHMHIPKHIYRSHRRWSTRSDSEPWVQSNMQASIQSATPCHNTRTCRYTLLLSCCLSRLLYLSDSVGLANSMPGHKKLSILPRISKSKSAARAHSDTLALIGHAPAEGLSPPHCRAPLGLPLCTRAKTQCTLSGDHAPMKTFA